MERYTKNPVVISETLTLLHSEINLSELQKTLDAQGLEIVENQKESMVGRKALADRTKGKLCSFNIWINMQLIGMTTLRVQENSRRGEGDSVQDVTQMLAQFSSVYIRLIF
jgi:hypothetical protein